MANKARDTAVGAFVLVLGAAFVWGVLWISAGGIPQRYDYYVTYMTESVSGLYVDAPLNFQGVDVGQVTAIDLDPADPRRVRLLLEVQQGTPINQGTMAVIEYQGLTGIANVNLIGAAADLPLLTASSGEKYPVIQSQASLYARLEAAATDLLASLNLAAKNINAFLGGSNRERLNETITNMALIAGNVAAQSDQLDSLLTRLDEVLRNAQTASTQMPAIAEDFARGAKSVADMTTSIQTISDNLAGASHDIANAASESGTGLTNFTRTSLPELSAMALELRLASENLRRLSETLAENPSSLIFGTTNKKRGPGE